MNQGAGEGYERVNQGAGEGYDKMYTGQVDTRI